MRSGSASGLGFGTLPILVLANPNGAIAPVPDVRVSLRSFTLEDLPSLVSVTASVLTPARDVS